MSKSARATVHRLPALLLLGLLALLLWGQCGALLFPGASHHFATVTGWVKRTDSLRSTPATLYLTLAVRNDFSQQIWVREAQGTLRFNGRAYPFTIPAALRDSLLYPWTEVTQAVAIPLRLPADSVALLRAALCTERPLVSEPQLQWQLWYSEKRRPNARYQGRTRSYLPVLKQQP
jgi:hypothetical protein